MAEGQLVIAQIHLALLAAASPPSQLQIGDQELRASFRQEGDSLTIDLARPLPLRGGETLIIR